MAAAKNVDAPDVDEREQDVYRPRSEEDLESVIDEMEEVDSEEVKQAVRQVSEIADGNLRTGQNSVDVHANAPIRSINNPEENQIELEDGTEAQVVGEEYFLSQNLPGFQDVGNIKWWTVMDDGSYREETRGRGSREHLQLNNEGDIHGYHVELDGRPLDAGQVQRLARNLRIRSEAANPVTEENIIPENIIEYSSREELLENEDLTEDEYVQQVEEAQKYGLISEDGELTLKGWITGADMEAEDLRAFEEISNGAETADFGRLRSDTLPGVEEDDLLSYSGTVSVSPQTGSSTVSTEGEFVNGEPSSELEEELEKIEEVFGHEIDDTKEEDRTSYRADLETFYREFVGLDTDRENFLDELGNHEASQVIRTVIDSDQGAVSDVDLDRAWFNLAGAGSVSGQFRSRSEDQRYSMDRWQKHLGLGEDDREEIAENTEFTVENNTLKANYKGERSGRLVEAIDGMETEIEGDDIQTVDPISRFSTSIELDLAYLELLDFEDDIKESNWNHEEGRIEKIDRYDQKSDELKHRIEEMEDEGLIETRVNEDHRSPAEISLDADDPLEYRDSLEKVQELDYIEFPTETAKSRELVKTDLEDIGVNLRVESDDERLLEEKFEGVEEELRDYLESDLFVNDRKTVEVKDYKKGVPGLQDLVNMALDKIGNEALTGKAREYIDEPEMVEKTIFDEQSLGSLSGRVDEYEVGDNDVPSDELLETLGEMYDEGLITAERKMNRDREDYKTRRTEYTDYGQKTEIDSFMELEEEQKEELRELDEEGVINLKEPGKNLWIQKPFRDRNSVVISAGLKYRVTDVDMEDAEADIDVVYEPENDFTYEANDQLRSLAENLDPLNFDSEPYEEVTVDTDFEYGEELAT